MSYRLYPPTYPNADAALALQPVVPQATLLFSSSPEFNISNARSTSELDSVGTTDGRFCVCHRDHRRSDDWRTFEHRLGEVDYDRRLKWLWYFVNVTIPFASLVKRRSLWRSLVRSNEIWMLWADGDEEVLPIPKTFQNLLPADWEAVTHVLSCRSRAPPWVRDTSTKSIPATSTPVLRLSMVLWVALWQTNCARHSFTSPVIDFQIPRLVTEWWAMLPPEARFTDVIDEQQWFDFCRLKEICPVHHASKQMWRLWTTIQRFLKITSFHFEVPLSLETYQLDCPHCNRYKHRYNFQEDTFAQSPMSASYEAFKPHVVALWCIQHSARRHGNFQHFSADPHDHWTNEGMACVLKLGNFLSPAVLRQMDEFLVKMPQMPTLRPIHLGHIKHLGPNTDWIPDVWRKYICDDLVSFEPPWIETEEAILSISSEILRDDRPVQQSSIHGTSWICAVLLFSIVRYTGFGHAATKAFVEIVEHDFADILEVLPDPPTTTASEYFLETLAASRHTCFNERTAFLYFSAYSLLVGIGWGVPIVGCGQLVDCFGSTLRRKDCSVCETTDAVRCLAQFVDCNMDTLAKTPGQDPSNDYPISLAKEILTRVDHPHRKGIRTLSVTLRIISNALEKALERHPGPDDEPIIELENLGWNSDEDSNSSIDDDEENEVYGLSGALDKNSYDDRAMDTDTLSKTAHDDPPPSNVTIIQLQDAELSDTNEPERQNDLQTPIVLESLNASGSATGHINPLVQRTDHNDTKCIPRPRKTEMVDEIKRKLQSLLEAHEIVLECVNGDPRLPWKSLPRILRNHNLKFINWPCEVPEPHTRNGIEKVPLVDVVKIYNALNDKDLPLDIRPITNAAGEQEISVIIENSSAASGKRTSVYLDEDGSNIQKKRRRMDG